MVIYGLQPPKEHQWIIVSHVFARHINLLPNLENNRGLWTIDQN
jgi:hypothetical protein